MARAKKRAVNSDLAWEMNGKIGQIYWARAAALSMDKCKHGRDPASRAYKQMVTDQVNVVLRELNILQQKVQGLYYARMAANQGEKK